MESKLWEDAVHNYEQDCRALNPIPPRAALSPEEEWQCRILGGHMYLMLKPTYESNIAQNDDKWVRRHVKFPMLIFTTNMPGLVAARELFPKPFWKVLFFLPKEWSAWQKDDARTDSDYQFHTHQTSVFRALSEMEEKYVLKQFPDIDLSTLRFHEEFDMTGRLCGQGGAHLWQWTGEKLELLEEAFLTFIS